MKPVTRQKIMEVNRRRIVDVIGSLAPDRTAALRAVRSALSKGNVNLGTKLSASEQSEAFRAGVSLGLSDLLDEVERSLIDKPEPSPRQLKRYLAEAEETDFNVILRSFLRSSLRKLPPLAPGKQPRFTSDQREKVVAEVQREKQRSRLPLKEIYKKLAKKYQVHWRTIQNCCRKPPVGSDGAIRQLK